MQSFSPHILFRVQNDQEKSGTAYQNFSSKSRKTVVNNMLIFKEQLFGCRFCWERVERGRTLTRSDQWDQKIEVEKRTALHAPTVRNKSLKPAPHGHLRALGTRLRYLMQLTAIVICAFRCASHRGGIPRLPPGWKRPT